jgi:hypothetical protein
LTRNSVTVIDDSIEDSWRLCHNEAEKKLRDSGYFLGIRLLTPHYNEPANYYIKPLPSCASNVKARRAELGIYTDAEHQFQLQRKMLTMQDDTQWDIQKLTEARDKASSNEPVKRSWEVLLLKGLNNKRFEIDSEKRKWWLNQQLASSPPDLQQPRVGNPSRQTHGETASQTIIPKSYLLLCHLSLVSNCMTCHRGRRMNHPLRMKILQVTGHNGLGQNLVKVFSSYPYVVWQCSLPLSSLFRG